MSADGFEIAAVLSVLLASALLASRRSPRAGLVVLALYGAQAGCLIWASRAIDVAWWSAAPRVVFLAVLLAVLTHRVSTYAFSRPPATRDRVIVPLVHVGQGWLVLELGLWPLRAFAWPPSPSLDAWVLGAPVVLSAIGLAWTHRKPRITRLRVPLRSLGRPLRVVHLSDLHLGPYLSEAKLAWLADTVSREAGDVVAITGDFLTLRTQENWEPLLRFVERLRAREGVYACLGNHDVEVADDLAATLRARGVTVLRDEVAWLRCADGCTPVAVAGLDWRSGREPQHGYARAFAELCDRVGQEGLSLVLCHQPSAFRVAPPEFAGIVLAGHLHGGQIGISWCGRGVSILRLFGMYDQGLFTRGTAWLYSHRGTGVYGFPMRVGVPAEIAVLTLVPQDRDPAAW